jgi:GH15 family glucan-1,4-alpha-glucosidase
MLRAVPLPLEDYALLSDTQAAALVGRDGSIDWLCLPRFDSGACFAALLGEPGNGRWLLAPAAGGLAARRAYRPDTLVLDTEWDTPEGSVRVTDCMPPRDRLPDVIRVVRGLSGRVAMRMQLIVRFDYGWIVPWVRRVNGEIAAMAGPDGLLLDSPVQTSGEDLTTVAEFEISAGEELGFVLTWFPSHLPLPQSVEPREAVERTQRWWEDWMARCTYGGEWREPVHSSLLMLKGLTYAPTGGIVAAATTSLPEQLGGPRNWDYRYCWLRDATFTLYSLLAAGFREEAADWRDWLVRAVAGDPADLQIMYGPAGERRLTELELDWLAGYEGSRPVRIGNAAVRQRQLDVYGEVMDALHNAHRAGIPPADEAWSLGRALLGFLEGAWREPDEGIWEVRGPARHFTHSKVMAWVAFDRGVKSVEQFGRPGPVDRWRALREEIHREVCREGYDSERGSFVQHYGSKDLDASLLMIPLVGFLPPEDERVRGTVAAIERELMHDGFVRRYESRQELDGLPPGEGAFLPCTFWLVDNLALQGRRDDARDCFERLLALRNDVGLLAEEYDPRAGRLVGNIPQAFSHVGLINAALNLDMTAGAAHERRES